MHYLEPNILPAFPRTKGALTTPDIHIFLITRFIDGRDVKKCLQSKPIINDQKR